MKTSEIRNKIETSISALTAAGLSLRLEIYKMAEDDHVCDFSRVDEARADLLRSAELLNELLEKQYIEEKEEAYT